MMCAHALQANLPRRLGQALAPLLAAALLAGCPSAHVPGPYDPHANVGDDREPLPEGRAALLAEADARIAAGPARPDLMRSLRCANAALTADPKDEEAAWRAARALYFLSALEGDKAARRRLSSQCMDAAHLAMASGTSAPGYYWGALCMGARAQAKSLEAIDLLPQMVDVARRAHELDPKIEHAGPDRVLGGIFLRAPAWPTSVGDLDEALVHLEEAVQLDPSWPENHLLYAEALAKDERYDLAKDALEQAETLMDAPDMTRWAKLWAKDRARVQEAVADGDDG